MSMPAIETCLCGREPEQNTALRGYKFSLSCMCGEDVICYLARSNVLEHCIDNWNSRVTGQPFLHSVQELSHPDSDGVVFSEPGPGLLQRDPLRRYYLERGNHVGGPWGGCS